LPFSYGLETSELAPGVEMLVEKAAPSELNQLIREDVIDIAVVSSLEYARNAKRYRILPPFCIGAGTFSESVLLISRLPLQELEGKKIVLSRESLSSQVLLKILLNRAGVRTSFEVMPQDPARMLKEGEACLLIGDGALFSEFTEDLWRYDLSHLWHDLTGLPFCFALWVVRQKFAEDHPELIRHFAGLLKESLDRNLADELSFVEDWSRTENRLRPGKKLHHFDKCFRYLSGLHFQITPELEKGLIRYFELAKEIGELETVPPLQYFSYES
jgi:chorismate dehydratase